MQGFGGSCMCACGASCLVQAPRRCAASRKYILSLQECYRPRERVDTLLNHKLCVSCAPPRVPLVHIREACSILQCVFCFVHSPSVDSITRCRCPRSGEARCPCKCNLTPLIVYNAPSCHFCMCVVASCGYWLSRTCVSSRVTSCD